jgi:hypothetical protein
MFSVCVQVEALRRTYHPSKESYRLSLIKKLRKLSPMHQKREQAPKCGSNEEERKTNYDYVRFEVSTAVTMMIIIFWEMTPCGSYKSLCLYKSLRLRSVTCSHSCTLKMEAIRSSETSVLIRGTRCHHPQDDNHQTMVTTQPVFLSECVQQGYRNSIYN